MRNISGDWTILLLAVVFLSACASDIPRSGDTGRIELNLDQPITIVLAGYGPSTSSFSQGLTHIGDQLKQRFGDQVDLSYVYNVNDPSYTYSEGSLPELVKEGKLTLAYLTMATGIPALEVAALPFLFSDTQTVRNAMDGSLGQAAAEKIEADTGLRVLGFYENGFRHISNSVRPVHQPEDLHQLKIRALDMQKRTFELLGADPQLVPLTRVVAGLESGELEGQENPFENVITYRMYPTQKYYTKTYHSYLSRPIFVNRQAFESWPSAFQEEFQTAVQSSVKLQRALHDRAELDAEQQIRQYGSEVHELSPSEHRLFVEAVAPIYIDAQNTFSAGLLNAVGL